MRSVFGAFALLLLLLAALPARAQPVGKAVPSANAAPIYALEDLLALARRENLRLRSAQSQALAARAGLVTARAYPNPEFEIAGAHARARLAGAVGGGGNTLGVTQRIELPSVRDARSALASSGVQLADSGIRIVENDVVAEIKTRFFDVLRRTEDLEAAREEFALTEQIRDRIRVRASTGEAPRFDLLRAENEVSLAARESRLAAARVAESRALLRQAVGAGLEEHFELVGDFYRQMPVAQYAALRDALLVANPELKRALADQGRADRQVNFEESLAQPSLALRLMQDSEPELRTVRAGMVLTLPLWDRRAGPIAEARAQAVRTRTDAELRRFVLLQSFDAAWQRYQSTRESVLALEGGVLQQARTVVDIAEAAYRYGERGILDYLDARRQLRGVRAELISTRFELHAALAELERLAASDLKDE